MSRVAAVGAGAFAGFATTWYLRSDYASLARWAETEARAGGDATLIVVVGEPPVSHYLEMAHAVYYDRADPRFDDVRRDGGRRELWSQQRLLSSPEELRHYSAGSTRVLLARSTGLARRAFEPQATWGARLQTVERQFKSVDGRLEGVSVRLAPGDRQGPE